MHAPTAFFVLALAGLAVAAPVATVPADKTVFVGDGVEAVLSVVKPSSGAQAEAVNAAQYQCQSGTALTYGIKTAPVGNNNRQKCQAALGNWVASAPGKLIASSGQGAPGATRVWQSTDVTLVEGNNNSEVLTNVIQPTSSNSNLEQQYTSGSQTYYNKALTLVNSWHDVTVQQASNGAVTLQYYINTCASDQNLAYKALATILQDSASHWVAECQ